MIIWFKVILIKIPEDSFVEIDKLILKFVLKCIGLK